MKAKKIAAYVFAGAVLLPIVIGAVMFVERLVQIRQDQAFVGAAEEGDTEKMAALLKRGVSVNATSFDNNSGLWTAAFNRQLPAARLLLSRGANPDTPSQFGNSPLESAVSNLSNDGGTAYVKTDVAIIHLLLDHGANWAAVKQNAESVALLKRSGVEM